VQFLLLSAKSFLKRSLICTVYLIVDSTIAKAQEKVMKSLFKKVFVKVKNFN
jgi:hypothetical protein